MNHVISAKVRRDAHTTTPVTVRPHEIAILQHIFGAENIHTMEGKVLEVKSLTAADVAGQTADSEDEFARLGAKYGGDEKGAYVEQVYGPRASGGLDKAIENLGTVVGKLVADDLVVAKPARGRKPAADPAAQTGTGDDAPEA
ncbi:hypothetical protein [Castellaniella caeni]|uniref:hypothetical protein n=1 Tax=Castellaniella caeni TaxID=266123 RepID=UPI000C9F7230|nr:hypothetical protein [Castellaniella caeni]